MARAPLQVLVIPYRFRSALEVALFRRADFDLWQFVSGGAERGETCEQAARREAFEEASIPVNAAYTALDATASVPACWFRAWSEWPETVVVVPERSFAVLVETEIQIGPEHVEYAWLGLRDAMTRLHFDSNKTALWELHERLFPARRCKRAGWR